jgi:hypothetical protein
MRPLFKLTFLLTLGFVLCIGLIRAQPYDDSQLRAFLTPPDGCLMPCFMGIRPGVTTAGEAMDLLEHHEAVQEVALLHNETTGEATDISWTWSDLQPGWLHPYPGDTASAVVQEGLITQISLSTLLPLGDIWAVWGAPTEYVTTTIGGSSTSTQALGIIQVFSNHGFWISRFSNCPYVEGLWNLPVSLFISRSDMIPLRDEWLSSGSEMFARSVRELQRRFC